MTPGVIEISPLTYQIQAVEWIHHLVQEYSHHHHHHPCHHCDKHSRQNHNRWPRRPRPLRPLVLVRPRSSGRPPGHCHFLYKNIIELGHFREKWT